MADNPIQTAKSIFAASASKADDIAYCAGSLQTAKKRHAEYVFQRAELDHKVAETMAQIERVERYIADTAKEVVKHTAILSQLLSELSEPTK